MSTGRLLCFGFLAVVFLFESLIKGIVDLYLQLSFFKDLFYDVL